MVAGRYLRQRPAQREGRWRTICSVPLRPTQIDGNSSPAVDAT
jgi:hypothetical protein